MNVRFEKEYTIRKKFRADSNLGYFDGRVKFVEFVVVPMDFARITIHGRVAKEP